MSIKKTICEMFMITAALNSRKEYCLTKLTPRIFKPLDRHLSLQK